MHNQKIEISSEIQQVIMHLRRIDVANIIKAIAELNSDVLSEIEFLNILYLQADLRIVANSR